LSESKLSQLIGSMRLYAQHRKRKRIASHRKSARTTNARLKSAVYQSVKKRDIMRDQSFIRTALAVASFAFALPAYSATCPFDGGGSDAVNDGLVLTRYALGITGAPLVASTRYASLDPLQVKNNIECVGCALDMNGDNAIDTVDTTIIARHLAGFSGNALTNGLALGSGSRPTPSSVQSFLASGCAVGGAINAFTQGGNSFGAPAVLGTNDAQNLTVQSGGSQISVIGPGGNGLRVVQTTGTRSNAPNVINGSSASAITQFVEGSTTQTTQGTTIAGGGYSGADCFDQPTSTFIRSCGNEARASFATISGGNANRVTDLFGTIGGGRGNTTSGDSNTVSGGRFNNASGSSSTIAGGSFNAASNSVSTIGGGSGNQATGEYSTIAGGTNNISSGYASHIPGGELNRATGSHSFAAGRAAEALHDGAFVWADATIGPFSSTGPNQFNVRAAGGVRLHSSTSQFFGNQGRQMLNLWNTEYGIGVQALTLYFRSFDKFSWHRQGVHDDAEGNPGGGTQIMQLTNTNLTIAGTLVQGSDRGIKENFASVNPKSILAKVASLPISLWNYKADDNKTQHVGPMAQDFKRLFGVGQDDKTIATVDASGVALAAIQGLHALVKEKDAEIARLKEKAKRVDSLERDLAAVMKRLGMK
jgi:trimeric autotransporter adhesin